MTPEERAEQYAETKQIKIHYLGHDITTYHHTKSAWLDGYKESSEWKEARIGNMPEYGTDILFLNANGGYWATKYYSQYNHLLGGWYTHFQIINPPNQKP